MYKNEIFVRFIITSNTLTPNEITKLLNKTPDQSWEINTLKNNHPTLTHKENKWEVFIKSQNIYHVDILINKLFLQLTPIQEKISLLKNIRKIISIVIYKKEIMPSITCDSKMISFLNDIGAELDIDVIEVSQ